MTREQIQDAIKIAERSSWNREQFFVSLADAILAAQVAVPVPDTCWACPVDMCTSANKRHDAWEIKKCRDMWQRLLVHFGRG